MADVEKQMELFEDGGLMDEGGTVDPVSGNDVPVGSTQEEVRDDIPAQLSEGEFVFPADVVRYWGLEKLMEMRQQAKAGLQRMEDMGQMGNSEEATLPDDIPFDINDLDIEDEPEYNMAVGGFIQPQAGYGTTVMQPTQPMMQPSMFANYAQQPATQPIFQPVQQQQQQPVAPTYTAPTYTGPSFQQLLPTTTGQYDEMKTYVNAAGEERVIPFVNGQPIYPIPTGFTLKEEAAKAVEETPTAVTTKTTRVADRGGRDDGDPPSGATMSFGGTVDPTTGLVNNAITANLSYSGIPGGFMGAGSAVASMFGFGDGISLNEGQTATIDSATMGNTTITFDADTFNSLNKNTVTSAERAEVKSIMETVGKVLGKSKYKNDLTFKEAKDIHDGYDRDLDMSVGYGKGQVDPSLAAAVAKSKGIDPSDKGLPDTSKDTSDKDFSPPSDPADYGAMSPEDVADSFSNNSKNDRDGRDSSDNDSSSGSSCFAAGTKFIMEDETTKNIEDIKIGDKLKFGGRVYSTIQGDGLIETWYNYGTTKVTGNHAIFENGEWKRVKDAKEAIPALHKEEILYTLINENHRMVAEDGVIYTDYDEVDNKGIEEDLLIQLNGQSAEATAA